MIKKLNMLTGQIRNFMSGHDDDESDHVEQVQDFRPYMLQEDEIKKLKLIARKKNIPLSEAISQAVDSYLQNTDTQPKLKISEERKEMNPLLRLEGLASRTLQKLPKGVQPPYDEATIIR